MNNKRSSEKDFLKVKLKRQIILSNVSLTLSLISFTIVILLILLKSR